VSAHCALPEAAACQALTSPTAPTACPGIRPLKQHRHMLASGQAARPLDGDDGSFNLYLPD
jgi:hypothetical protein